MERFENDEALDAVYGDVHFVKSNNLNKCVRYYSSKIFRRKLMRLGFMPAHPSFYMRKGVLMSSDYIGQIIKLPLISNFYCEQS